MKRLFVTSVFVLVFASLAFPQDLLVVKGRVKDAENKLVKNIEIRLLEAKRSGSTDEAGFFEMTLPPGWHPGMQTTVYVDLEGYRVLRPWNGTLVLRIPAPDYLEEIIVAKDTVVGIAQDPQEIEKILQLVLQAEIQGKGQPEGLSELAALRHEARQRNISLKELVTLLEEWKAHAEKEGNLSEQSLAALYEKRYNDAVKLLAEDIASDQKKIGGLQAGLPRKYLNKGIAHAGLYEHKEAEMAFRKVIELDSTLLQADLWLAYTLRFTGRLIEGLVTLQKSREKLEAAADSSDTYTWILTNIGIVYKTQGKLDSALVVYRQALAINQKLDRPEGMADNLGNIGIVYQTQGKLDSALVFYRQALAINQKLDRPEGMADNLGNIGIVYDIQGKLDSALVFYRQALAINQKLDRPEGMAYQHFNIGLLLENRENLAGAAEHFNTAFILFSHVKSPYTENTREALLRVTRKPDPFFTGHIYLRNRQATEALEAYRKALAAHPDSLRGYIFIAQVYTQIGLPDSVVAYYRRALAKNPNYAEALNNLAWHYARGNENLNEALELSKYSLEIKPNYPPYLDTLAEIHLRVGSYTEAKQANDRAKEYAKDEELLKSIDERAAKIEAKLQKQGT